MFYLPDTASDKANNATSINPKTNEYIFMFSVLLK